MGSTAVYSGAARRKEDKESLNVLVCLIYPGIDQNFHTLLCHAGLNGLFRCGKRIFVTEEPLPWKLIFSAQHHFYNGFIASMRMVCHTAVSYTHLTLPTKLEV